MTPLSLLKIFGLLSIILILLSVFYLSLVNRNRDTFVVKHNLKNIDDVTAFLLSNLSSGDTSYADTLKFIQDEAIVCESIASDNLNLADWFPDTPYDSGLSCYMPLAARKFNEVGVLDVWLTQPKLRLSLVFSEGVFQDFTLEVVRTGL